MSHLRTSQAARRAGMTPAAFYKAIQRGTLEKAGVNCNLWVGGQRRFDSAEIDRLVDPVTCCMRTRLGVAS
jgi:hypothetical protein